ncbi:MAG: segregation and condensation protein segregation and condensation protein [Candidatus Parcubacteria bacterium]|jgi:segregation and condensation protein A
MTDMDEAAIMPTQHTYTIKTEQFEGPLDVLLNLIEKRKLLINHISLGEVTEEFIQFAHRLEGPHGLRQKASFVSVASILILIKAKSLLPILDITPEEEVDIADLEKRLKMLELMRKVGKTLGLVYGKTQIFRQGNFRREIRIFAPAKDIGIDSIFESINRALASVPKKEKELPKVRMRQVMSLEDMMESLSTRMQSALKMTFTAFSKAPQISTVNLNDAEIVEVKRAQKQHVVVSFLALLELVKQNMLIADQTENFAEIDIGATAPGAILEESLSDQEDVVS